ncbi:hypothetical protein Sm713_54670 [Streptomyces sp. TS71-3]|nr:hypothetical protein Sm713_54670 [Streptomyces sp. TS71-3]
MHERGEPVVQLAECGGLAPGQAQVHDVVPAGLCTLRHAAPSASVLPAPVRAIRYARHIRNVRNIHDIFRIRDTRPVQGARRVRPPRLPVPRAASPGRLPGLFLSPLRPPPVPG